MLEYLYGKSFGSKLAWANRKEGDPVNLLPTGSGHFRANPFPRINTPTFYRDWGFSASVVRQMPGYTMQSRGTGRTPLPRRGVFT